MSDARQHLTLVASLGCIACRREGLGATPAQAHHINCKTMGRKASDEETVPLCVTHHTAGGYGVAVHAGLKAFERRFGTEKELLEQTLREVEELKKQYI